MLELLAVVFALESFNFYLRAAPRFRILTDHSSLVQVLKKDLRDVPPRLLAMRERTVPYIFTVEYIKGVRNIAADCISHYPNFGTKLDVEEEVFRRIVMKAHEE